MAGVSASPMEMLDTNILVCAYDRDEGIRYENASC